MNDQARRIWKTPEGVDLLRNMLAGETMNAQDRQTLADPPKLAQGPRPEAVAILAAMMVRRAQRQMRERDVGGHFRHNNPNLRNGAGV